MKKQGFVLVESVTVLVVVLLSLTMLYTSYALVTRKAKEKENYDVASDKYIIYAVSQLGTSYNDNYKTQISDKNYIKIDKSNCSNNPLGKDAAGNSKNFIENYCDLFNDLEIDKLYIVKSIAYYLYGDGKSETAKIFDNGTIEYIKTLQMCNESYEGSTDTVHSTGQCPNNSDINYMIAVFKRNNESSNSKNKHKYNYASIQL